MGQILSNITRCICGDQLDVEERLVHQLLPLSSSTPESNTSYASSNQLGPKERVFHQVLPPFPSAPEGIFASVFSDALQPKERIVHRLLPLSSSPLENNVGSVFSNQVQPNETRVHQLFSPPPSAASDSSSGSVCSNQQAPEESIFTSFLSNQLQPKERHDHQILSTFSSAPESVTGSIFCNQLQPNERTVHQLVPSFSSSTESVIVSVCSSQLEPEQRNFALVFSNPLQAEERQVHLPSTPSTPECVTEYFCSNQLEPEESITASVCSNPLQDKESKKPVNSQVLPGNPQEAEMRETHQIRSKKSKPIQPTGSVQGQVDRPVVVKEKRIKHYTCNQKILLVGEGDFSFSACLAEAFGSAANMVATSLNSRKFLNKNYGSASDNIRKLKMSDCEVYHGVDATTIGDKKSMFKGKIFDRIIFNFPHAGFSNLNESREVQIKEHQKLVRGFLKNAKKLIQCGGEIHISHMTTRFHSEWDLEELGSAVGLELLGTARFRQSDYPGYNSKYGFGGDGNFDCIPSKTFKFGLPIAPSSNGL